ncbi:MAG: phosphotransferase [Phycisphaerae bacterium]|nr:phosphotransferase [Phycisphaerae bacterium]
MIAEPHAEPVKRNAAREVWRVTIEEQEFFVKLYRETGISGIARALLRGPGCELEWRAGDHARRHQIPTVEPVAYGTIGARGLRGPGIFITRAMPRALPLNEHWSRRVLVASPDIRRIKASAVIEAAAHSVARAHQFGFLHRDLHAGNLLASEGDDGRPCIAFVDLHNVRLGSHVPDPLAVRNLAQLNQWFRRRASRTDRLRFLRHYIAFREDLSRRTGSGPNIGLSYRQLVKALGEAADRHARQLWAKRDRVAMRDGKYFCRLKTRGGWRGHAYLRAKHTSGHSRASQMQFNRSQWRCWLDNPLDLLRKDRSRLIKDSHTAYVCRAQLPADEGPLEIVCKRARPRTWLKKCYYLFCKSRNLESWRRGYQLLNRDLPTARPLAVMERRFAGLLLDSVVMTEALSRARDFDALLRMDLLNQDPRTLRRQKDQLIDRLARLVKDMQTKGFAHRDFKAANLMVQWDLAASQLPRIVLVDLDGLILRRRLSRRQRLRPLMRLNVSLDEAKVVTRTDRLRFLKAYATIPNGAREDWRSLWREIERMSYRKRAHKEKRRKWKLKRYGRA